MAEQFIRKGNNYYRNNSDSTQTQVIPTQNGYFTWVQPDGKKVRSQKKYKITSTSPKKEESFWSKLGKGFVNATIGASVAEAPAIQIANGWYIDDDGNWKQDTERPGAKQLRPALAAIGATGAAVVTPGGIPSMLIGTGTEIGERALFGKSLGDITSNFVKNHNPFSKERDHYLGSFGHMVWNAGSNMVRPEYGLYGSGKFLTKSSFTPSNVKSLKYAFQAKNQHEIATNPITKSMLNSPITETILTKTPIGKRALETVMRTTPAPNPIPETLQGMQQLPWKPRINYIIFGKNPKLRKLFGQPNMHYGDNSWSYKTDIPYTADGGEFGSFDMPITIRNGRTYTGLVDAINDPTIGKGYGDIIDAYLYGTTIDPKIATLSTSNVGRQFFNNYILRNYPNKNIKSYTVKGDVNPKTIKKTSEWDGRRSTFAEEFRTNDNTATINVAGHNYQYGWTDPSSTFPQAQRGFDIWKFNPKDYHKGWNVGNNYLESRGVELIDKAGTPIIFEQPWKLIAR